MGMFTMRKPRGFNHPYIYVDERKEKLAKMDDYCFADILVVCHKHRNHLI